MKKILMYSGPMCNFCEAAKRLLDRNKLKYDVKDISSEDGIREEIITDTSLSLGRNHNLFEITEEHSINLTIKNPIISNEDLDKIKYISHKNFVHHHNYNYRN